MTKTELKKIVDSTPFHKTVSLVIIFCAIVLGVETTLIDSEWERTIIILDIFITCFFIIEIIMRMFAEKSLLHFFHIVKINRAVKEGEKMRLSYSENGFWNWFDFIITTVSAIAIFTHFFSHPEYLLIARMFRIFRIFRLLEISSQLKAIERKIISIVPTVFTFALLLFILIYIHAIIGFYLFEGRVLGSANFSTLFNSILMQFQVMTLDGWGEIMGDVGKMNLGIPPFMINFYFISFVVLTAIISLNVFIAVLASGVEDRISKDMKEGRSAFTKLIKAESAQTEEDLEGGLNIILAEFSSLKSEMNEMRQSLDELKK